MSHYTTASRWDSEPVGTAAGILAWAQSQGSLRLDFLSDALDTWFAFGPNPKVNLNPDLCAAHSAHECGDPDTGTAWQSDIYRTRGVLDGLGVTDDEDQMLSFANGRDAALADLVHRFAYVHGEITRDNPLYPYIALDPRYGLVIKGGNAGKVATIAQMGGKWWTDPDGAAGVAGKAQAMFGEFTVPGEQPSGGIVVKIPSKPSEPKPKIYYLANDYALFGLTKAQADEIISHFFQNRNGGSPQFIVLHIQDGTTRGSLSYWVSVDASSTVMANRDGSILVIIPEQHGPWTNGDVNRPSAEAMALIALGGNANNWSLTIEAEGGPWDVMPAAQKSAIIWQVQTWMIAYPDIAERYLAGILRHGFINTVDKINCGLYRPEIVAAIEAWASDTTVEPQPEPKPVPMPLYPRGMSAELARELYEAEGKFTASWTSKAIGWDVERSECQAWLVWGKAQLDEGGDYTHAEWPALSKIIRRGKTKNVHAYVYSNGRVYEKVVRKDPVPA